jgi:pilus assembly protein Flp/PilA
VLRQILSSDRGASMVEYAIVLALICVLCVGVVGALGSNLQHTFRTVGSCMNTGGAQNPGGVCAGNAGGHGKP